MWLILVVFALSFVLDFAYKSYAGRQSKEVDTMSPDHHRYQEGVDVEAARINADGSANSQLSQEEYAKRANSPDEYSAEQNLNPTVNILYCIG